MFFPLTNCGPHLVNVSDELFLILASCCATSLWFIPTSSGSDEGEIQLDVSAVSNWTPLALGFP